ncbi:hypothetical protein GR247_15670 [Rhizobium leguminosarum]|uniref:hypothetical protein n=1 Tax=Rhizobium TaxID=379 RepID=UPI00103040FD|nr:MULTISPECIES: hypothetical protein [Rhizobium]MCJ9691118.1 hypothetical protein [Rhizobium sp. PRIMUS64]NEJ21605.1 hypothetical protein [Rhizobium leguminosarum]TAY38564.1 hypothetical protein ELH89_16270 [Rhizobium leguminosarum]
MTQNDDARLLIGDRIPERFLPELRLWARRKRGYYFTRNEIDLFRIAAVAYADAARPSVGQIYRLLCALVDEDAERNSLPVRKPSLTTFRRIVKSMPDEFVRYMRFGRLRRVHTFELVSAATQALEINFN